MGKEVRLKMVELNGVYRYFAFPSQMHVNKFLDVMESCQICDCEWIGGERVAVAMDRQSMTLNTMPVMTRAEYNAAKDAYEKAQQDEADQQEEELAQRDIEDELDTVVTQEEIEEQQEAAGVPEPQDMAEIFDEEEAKLEPGESDPRD